jgi:hypothetical protein
VISLQRASFLPETRIVDVAAAHNAPLELSFTPRETAIDASGRSAPARAIDPSNPYGGPP